MSDINNLTERLIIIFAKFIFVLVQFNRYIF